MQSLTIFFAAALLEIAGCFAVWGWWRLDKSALWLIPAVVLLSGFAWLLTLVDVEQAGRAYAIYGGIYIVASLAWLWAVEGHAPDRWDVTGAVICLLGAAIILWAPRSA
jgi:small multidrug resistance family-3 protein